MAKMILYDTRSQSARETQIRMPEEGEVAWIPLIGKAHEETERILTDVFRCHPLLVEDCIAKNQRPKLDRYENHLLLTFFHIRRDLSLVEMEHVIGPNYVITVCADEVDSIAEAAADFKRNELRHMEFSGAILYRLLDKCVDDYIIVSDKIDDKIEKYEQAIIVNPHVKISGEVFRLKRRLHTLRRILFDERNAIGELSHQRFPYSRKEADVYFTDIHDHISQVLDSIDSFRDSLTGLLDLQVNMKSDRMNEIIKTLTIVSSIFLPLTFVVGLYGMNFRYMPELDWPYAYPLLLVIMIIIAGSLWFYYKKKKWL